MSGAQHTPGPWHHAHRKGADGQYRTEVFSETHGGIATCEWTPKHCGNGVTATYRAANALLIATAPDLLDALQEAELVLAEKLRRLGADPAASPTYVRIRAAITKATGATA